jgi:glycosyltransferase involved in cell wall biosynthesis
VRIAFLSPSGQFGGAETSLREILGNLRTSARDWELWLVLGEDGPLAEYSREQGVRVRVVPFPRPLARAGDAQASRGKAMASLAGASLGALLYRRALRRILRSISPHIVHSNGLKMHLLGALCRPANAHLIWHIHDYVSARRSMRRLLALSQGACSLAIANSNSVARDLKAILPSLRIVTVYNAVDVDRYCPTGPKLDLDARSGLPPAGSEIVRVGLVATFARWKGHKVFLEALARLRGKSNIRGYIVGAPIYQTGGSQWSIQELKQHVRELGLEDSVGFTGFLVDTAAVMRSLDIVVHASTEPEPFGMVIIEAMACGRPVIVASAGGAQEIVQDGEIGGRHSPGNVEELTQQIERLAASEQLRLKAGREGRKAAVDSFSGPHLVKQLFSVYGSLCDSAPASPAGREDLNLVHGLPAEEAMEGVCRRSP